MAIVYNGTTLTSLTYNGSTVRAISYNGTTSCISCSYSSSASCCTSSSSGSLCNSACATSVKISCLCSTGIGLCDGTLTAAKSISSVSGTTLMTLQAEAENNEKIIGTYEITQELSDFLAKAQEVYEEWLADYETYYDDENVSKQWRDEIEQYCLDAHSVIEQEKAVLLSDIRQVYPNCTRFEIRKGETNATVYGR